MANLATSYLGIKLRNPLIVGACSLTSSMESIRKLEERGAGALVIKSLFEEQIAYQNYAHDEDLSLYDNWHAEMASIFPKAEHAGPDEHLMWTQRAKEASGIPVFASLNALTPKTWSEWARKLEQTGVDALELNFFSLPDELENEAAEVEAAQAAAVAAVKKAVSIPVSIKLSPFYTSPLPFVRRLVDAGADGLVLFNRLFHQDINISTVSSSFPFDLSSPADRMLPLRFTSMLGGRVGVDLCASNGIHTGKEAVELLLAGATAFEVVSTLYVNKIEQIAAILTEIERWMDAKGYADIAQFRGKLSEVTRNSGTAYKRAEYVRMLLQSNDYVSRPALI